MFRLPLITCFCALLVGCQTVGPGDIEEFEVPLSEKTSIVLPDGYQIERVELVRLNKLTHENAYFLTSRVSYISGSAVALNAMTRTNFISIVQKSAEGAETINHVDGKPISFSSTGPGFYSIVESSNELCMLSSTNHGDPMVVDNITVYPGELFVTLCEANQTLASRPGFEEYALKFLSDVSIRPPDNGLSITVN